jgi:hypothetical protein
MTHRIQPFRGRALLGTVALAAALLGLSSRADATVISLNTIVGTTTNTFDGLPLGNTAGLIDQTGATYGEHFAGQIVVEGPVFDTLAGTPTDPLTLVANPELANNIGIAVSDKIYGDFSNAIGEGALSILLAQDATVFGFNITGANDGGTFTTQFFSRDGGLLGMLTQVTANGFFGFQATGGDLIAGISITNTDPSGILYDDITFDSVGASTAVPEPMSLVLLGTGLVGTVVRRHRRRS